jgi:adenylyltransferase/sulfurtransferase
MPLFKIPSQLRDFTNNKSTVNVQGKDVLEAVNDLISKHQNLKDKLFTKNQKIQPFVKIYLEEENIRFIDNLETKLEEKSELSIILTAAG